MNYGVNWSKVFFVVFWKLLALESHSSTKNLKLNETKQSVSTLKAQKPRSELHLVLKSWTKSIREDLRSNASLLLYVVVIRMKPTTAEIGTSVWSEKKEIKCCIFSFHPRIPQKKHPEIFFSMFELPVQISGQSFLSIFTKKYLCKCKDAYFILQNKYVCIHEDSFGAKILIDDCAFSAIIFAV